MNKGIIMIAATIIISAACKDSNTTSQPQVAQTKATVQTGDWIITNFSEDTKDETAHFSGYTFTFKSDGTLTASKATTTVSGTWSLESDDHGDDDNDKSGLELYITFSTPADFSELSEDWRIVSTSSSKIELTHVSGGNGGTDFLTFEKP